MPNHPHRPAASAGITVAASLLGAYLIPAGGLAPLVLAAAVSLLVTPLAVRSWRGRAAVDPVGSALVDAAALLLLSILLGSLAATGAVWAVVVGIVWLAAALLGRAWPAVVALGCIGVLGAVASGLGADVATALTPVPSDLGPALPHAVVLGVLLSGLGVTGFTTHLPRSPGDHGAPWLVTGAGIAALLAVAVATAATYGRSMGSELGVPRAVAALLAVAGVAAVVGNGRPHTGRRAVAGLVASMVVAAATVVAARDLSWALAFTVVPVLVGAQLARLTVRATGRLRWGLGATTLAVFGSVAMPFEVPDSVPHALALALLLVGAFWSVMAQREALVTEVAA